VAAAVAVDLVARRHPLAVAAAAAGHRRLRVWWFRSGHYLTRCLFKSALVEQGEVLAAAPPILAFSPM
jgi:hypothetical protein